MKKKLLFRIFLLLFQIMQIPLYAQNMSNGKVIKTYTGSFPYYSSSTSWTFEYSVSSCTYQYYEEGYNRIYHGSFSLKAGSKEIKGTFKNGKREGIWIFSEKINNEISQIWNIMFINGEMNGTFSYSKTERNKLIEHYKTNIDERNKIFTGNCKIQIYNNQSEFSMNEYGYLNGVLTCHGDKMRILTCNFNNGIPSALLIRDLRTGRALVKTLPSTTPPQGISIKNWFKINYKDFYSDFFLCLTTPPLLKFDIFPHIEWYDSEGEIKFGLLGNISIVKQELAKQAQRKKFQEDQAKLRKDLNLTGPTFTFNDEHDFSRFLARNIRYPMTASERGICGIVKAKFIIQPSGEIKNIEAVESPHISLTNAVIGQLKAMRGLWQPIKVEAKPIPTTITISVKFSIDDRISVGVPTASYDSRDILSESETPNFEMLRPIESEPMEDEL